MNLNPEVASFWKGRILMMSTCEKTEKPLLKKVSLKEEAIKASKPFIEKYWDIFLKTCSDLNDPWEKYFNEIYEKEVCISPVQSLTVHITNINSGYGLSPFIDYKKLWDENNYK